jgi:hypothetical protein
VYFQLLGLCWSWLYYCTHLPLTTTVGVCVNPVGVGQVYVGGVDGNVHVATSSVAKTNSGKLTHSRWKIACCPSGAGRRNVAIHVSSVRIAVTPPMVEGLHGGVGDVGVFSFLQVMDSTM